MENPQRRKLAREHMEFARELGRMASERAAQAVNLNLGIDIHVSAISSGLLSLQTLTSTTDDMQNTAIGVYSRVEGGAPGHMVFLLPHWEGRALALALKGLHSTDYDCNNPDWHAPLLDLGRTVITTCLESFAAETGLEFRAMPTMIVEDMAWAIVSSLIAFPFQDGRPVMVMSAHFGDDPGVLDSLLLFIPDPGSLTKMVGARLARLGQTSPQMQPTTMSA